MSHAAPRVLASIVALAATLLAACADSPGPRAPEGAAVEVAPQGPPLELGAAPQKAEPRAAPRDGAEGARDEKLTVERAVHARRITDLHLSPDGSRALATVFEPDDAGTTLRVWLADLKDGSLRPITFGPKSDRRPRWSPDGRSIALLSSRAGDNQVYVMPADGGEAHAVTSFEGGVRSYVFSPDGARVAVLARTPKKPTESDAQVADREDDLDRVWVVDLATKKTTELTSGPLRVDELTWPTPERLVVVASEHPRREAWNTAIYGIAVQGGAVAAIAQPSQPFDHVTPSPGGKAIAYVGTAARGPIPHDLFVQSAGERAAHDASRAVDRAVLDARWQDDDHVVVRVTDGFQYKLFGVGRDPAAAATPIELPMSVRDFDVGKDGTIVYVGVAFDRLQELYVKPKDGPARPVGHLQDAAWSRVKLADAALFRYPSFDGTPIEAALLSPASTSTKPPLVVLVHGGPSGAFSAEYIWFNAWAQLLVARGDAVLMVNPRGSTGYGEAFVKKNRADLGGGDYRDVMAGVDAVVARGQVDPSRLGIGGWSYGGQMTAWAIGHTRRFKAAVDGAGVFDESAEFQTEDDPAGDAWFFGLPWDHPEIYAKNSPITFIRSATTPTLIVHGEADENNPVAQSRGLYRALKYLGVEAELVVYPGEPHGPRKAQHQKDILERMLGWYETHL